LTKSSALTPQSDAQPPKKKKKKAAKGLLSFGGDEDEDSDGTKQKMSAGSTPDPSSIPSRKLTPNPHSALPAPKVMTKASLAAEASERERLRKEFLELQEKGKATEIAIPFVFYDGSNIPGGTVKIKKGDHIWLILERARKIAAEHGVAGTGTSGTGMGSKSREDSRRQWARVGVDDLMCVRGDIIVPHHYEIYYFIANKTEDPGRPGRLLFDYSGTAPDADNNEDAVLRDPRKDFEELEGGNDDPTYTKVVDRRWYEKNKHIFPASTWKEFKAGKEFEELAKGRKDAEGNAFFYS
jgi:protein FAM50